MRFADYSPLPQGRVGHPHGLEWFCAEHDVAAEALSGKRIDEAMFELRRDFDASSPTRHDASDRQPAMLHRWAQALRRFRINP